MNPISQSVNTSLSALTRQYEAIAHNLANASTTGYKRLARGATQEAGPGGASGAPTVRQESPVDFTQGPLTRTGRPLDVALHGEGFFVIETPEGPLYTRNGVFQVNTNGQLVDFRGRTVAGDGGPIVLPPDAAVSGVRVSRDGTVSADGQELGRLRIVEFEERENLTPQGAHCFRAPADATPADAESTAVQQGFQETSNVRVVRELVDLIMVTRMYEAGLKTIQSQDDRTKNLLQAAMG